MKHFTKIAQAFSWLAVLTTTVSTFAAEWQPVATGLLKAEKSGYGGLSGLAVDPRTGDVYVSVSDLGIFRSKDAGATWKRHGQAFKGRTEWPGCLLLDPIGGKRLLAATVYGAPIALGDTTGADWKLLDKKATHVDWCIADWSDPDLKFLMALKHESGGILLLSRDGGKSFTELGKGHGPGWIFDADTAVLATLKSKDGPRPGVLRTTDGGKTFLPGGGFHATALPKWRDGSLYWLAETALMRTADKGKSWQKVCDLKDGLYGPIFGKEANHLFVLTKAGIVESADGGASWSKPLPPPKKFAISALTWIDYDPTRDVLYLMKMTSDLFRMDRK